MNDRNDIPPTHRGRGYFVLVGIAVAVGLTLRWWNLGGESLWFDEAYTAWAAQRSVGELFDVVRVDNSPPLYYLSMHFWTRVFGESECALRAPSALVGSLALILTIPLARRILDNAAAEVAAVVLSAVSFLLIRYAHEARCYEMLGFLSLTALWGIVRWSTARWSGILLIAVSMSAMTWMHNMAWLYVASFACAMIVWFEHRNLRSRAGDAAAVVALVVLLYLPWAGALVGQVSKISTGFWIPRPDLPAVYYMGLMTAGVKILPIASMLREYCGGLQPGLSIAQVLLSLTFPALGIALATNTSLKARCRAATVLYAAIVPILLAFAISLAFTSVFTPKILTGSAALLPLALAGAVVGVRRSLAPIAYAALGVLVFFALTSVIGQFIFERKENWQAVHSYLAALPPSPRLLVFVGNDGEIALEYYERRRGKIQADRTGAPGPFYASNPPRAMQRVDDINDFAAIRAAVESGRYRSIILVGTHLNWSDPAGHAIGYLQENLRSTDRLNFAGVYIEQFEPRTMK